MPSGIVCRIQHCRNAHSWQQLNVVNLCTTGSELKHSFSLSRRQINYGQSAKQFIKLLLNRQPAENMLLTNLTHSNDGISPDEAQTSQVSRERTDDSGSF